MAGSSLLTLLDDIASILDDVSILTKVAAKKTAGVLGDDLALNAQQVAGVRAERELPVVWAVAKGSLLNKVILVPAALAISALAHWAVAPLLMVGGAYLCFEGVEKVLHAFLHREDEQAHRDELARALRNPEADLVALERDKIKGAIRTDFILSAEIITISLGAVAESPLTTQIGVLVSIAALMTVGVYGLVAGIVKLDDLGAHLVARGGAGRALGQAILTTAPWLMKSLSVAGTAAMFLVGGGILSHGIPQLAGLLQALEVGVRSVPGVGGLLAVIVPLLADALLGFVVGGLVLGCVSLFGRLRRR